MKAHNKSSSGASSRAVD